MSALVDKQARFLVCIGKLISYADDLGFQLTEGDGYRDPRVPYGHQKSCHRNRLAHDFNLYVGGEWIQDSGHIAWKRLGNFWESLDPLARWGGKGSLHPEGLEHDGNHFSFSHEGVE